MNLVVKEGVMGPRVDLKLERKGQVVENFSINQQMHVNFTVQLTAQWLN